MRSQEGFDWEQYRPASGFSPKEGSTALQESNFNWENFRPAGSAKREAAPAQESKLREFAQSAASSVPGQAALGAAKRFTWPADLLKLFTEGASREVLADLKEGDEDLDVEKAKEAMAKALGYFPTQEKAEELIEHLTGVNLAPKDESGELARGVGEMFSLTPGKNLLKKALGTTAGIGSQEALKAVGVPETLANIAGAGIAGATSAGKRVPKTLNAPEQQLRETAEKFDLRKFRGMEHEKAPSVKPTVSKAKKAALREELGTSTKEAIGKLIEENIPVKKMRDMGIDLEHAYETAYGAARKTADKMGNKPIDFSNVVNWIDSQIKATKASSPSLSNQQKIYVNLLNNERKHLLGSQKKGGIDLITGRAIPTKTKHANADQALNQYRNYNDNVKGIYRKPEFSGAENTVKKAYAGLNDQIIQSVDKVNPELAKELKFANKVFHETSKLNQVEGIIETAFKDGYNPQRLSRLLESKRDGAFIKRSLGTKGVEDLKAIAHYGKEAEKRVFKTLNVPNGPTDLIKEWGVPGVLLLTGHDYAAWAYKLGLPAMSLLQGQLISRASTRKSYANFLKAAAAGQRSTIKRYAQQLEEAIDEEFGSMEEFLKEVETE